MIVKNKILNFNTMTKKYPKGISCQNSACKNTMLISTHSDPGEDYPLNTPKEKVHYLNRASKNICTVQCANCGHYTICKP